jgi:two-component system NtrC family response regulator
MSNHRILIIDDQPRQVQTLAGFLKKKGFEIEKANSGFEGIEIVKKCTIDLIITDFKMPELDGLGVLKLAKEINPLISVILMTAFGTIQSAKQAMYDGAVYYLSKPINLKQLTSLINSAFENQKLISEKEIKKTTVKEKFCYDQIIAKSKAMEDVLNIASRAASSRATVLITGESGTGKELIAGIIHSKSQGINNPLIAVNCAALTEGVLESELFGHEKGAFTGAGKMRKGRFELAENGTLFIDEVGEIPLTTQVKLLRVLQEQTIERVGDSESIKVNARIIAATNRDLENMIEIGRFREDLFYRLNVIRINIPPLRKRKEDIPLLLDYFLKKYSAENNTSLKGISENGMKLLLEYDYSGNVRELENIIEQAVVLCRNETINDKDLPLKVRCLYKETKKQNLLADGNFIEQVDEFEKQLIDQALEKAQGVQTRASKLLGIPVRNLRYKMQKYGLK